MPNRKKTANGPIYPAHLVFTQRYAGQIVIGVVVLMMGFMSVHVSQQRQIIADNIICISTNKMVEKGESNFYLQMDCEGRVGFVGHVVEIANISRLGGSYRCTLHRSKDLTNCRQTDQRMLP